MAITRLDIHCLRNLSNVSISPSPSLNVIDGLNGSGKTSILEAINILSIGRSFRTHKISSVIQHQAQALTLFSKTINNETPHAIGLKKGKAKEVIYRIDGNNARSQSQIASLLPTKTITTRLHALLEEAPEERRSFLDWGLFHVKPDFVQAYHQFKRIHAQRNALLKDKELGDLDYWDTQFACSGEIIHQLRLDYLNDLRPYLQTIANGLLEQEDIQVSYKKGWHKETPLKEALYVSRETDIKRGFTSVGPQRADIQFKVNGFVAAEHLSRGQEKVFIIGLHIAQVLHLYEQRKTSSILLIDDIASEVDEYALTKLLAILRQCNTQIFITTIDHKAVDVGQWKDKKLFHVERGLVREVV